MPFEHPLNVPNRRVFDDKDPVVEIVSCVVSCHLERKTRERGSRREREGKERKRTGKAKERGSCSPELSPISMVNDPGLFGGEGGR